MYRSDVCLSKIAWEPSIKDYCRGERPYFHHVSILAAASNAWFPLPDFSKGSATPAPSKLQAVPPIVDPASSWLILGPQVRLPLITPSCLTYEQRTRQSSGTQSDDVEEAQDKRDAEMILPLATALLVRRISVAQASTAGRLPTSRGRDDSVLQINTLFTWTSDTSTLPTWKRSTAEFQREWVANLNDLAELGRLRMREKRTSQVGEVFDWLPWHLRAVKRMLGVVHSVVRPGRC